MDILDRTQHDWNAARFLTTVHGQKRRAVDRGSTNHTWRELLGQNNNALIALGATPTRPVENARSWPEPAGRKDSPKDGYRCIADLHLLPMDFGCMQLVHFYPLEALPKPPPAPRPMSQIQGTRVQPIQQMRRRPETALLSLGNLEALGSTQVHALGAPRAFLDQLVHLLAHAFIHGQSLSTPIGPLYETRFRARPSSNYGTIPA